MMKYISTSSFFVYTNFYKQQCEVGVGILFGNFVIITFHLNIFLIQLLICLCP